MRTRTIRLVVMLAALLVTVSVPGQAVREAEAQNFTTYLPVAIGGSGAPGPIIPVTTEVLSEATTDQLVNISNNGAVFTFAATTPELNQVQPGDIIVSGPTDEAAEGFLKRVVSKTTASGQVQLLTEQAALEEAIDTGSFSITQPLSPNQIVSSRLMPGVALVPAEERIDFTFAYEIKDFVLRDKDGNLNTKGDQMLLDGTVSFTKTFNMDIEFKRGNLEFFEFIDRSDVKGEFDVISQFFGAEKAEDKVFAQHQLSPIIGFIGPVPIVITPVVNLVIGYDGDVQVGVKLGFEYEVATEAGARWVNGQASWIGDNSHKFTGKWPTFTTALGLEMKAGPELVLKFYGLIGPKAEIEVFLRGDVDPFDVPWWELSGGLRVVVGLKIEALKKTFVDEEQTVIEFSIVLLRAGKPPEPPRSPSPPDGATNQPTSLTLGWFGEDENGDPLTYDVYLDAGQSPPTTLACDDRTVDWCAPGTLLSGTTYYWQVIARDPDGNETAGPVWRFTTAGGNNLPPFIPEKPVPADHASQQELYLQLKWTGGDPEGDPVGYTVYLEAGDDSPDVAACTAISATACDVGPLSQDTTYYWRVEAIDSAQNKVTGPVWRFTTRQEADPIKTIDVALIIDSSGSMAWNDPANMRKAAAKVFIEAMVSGDRLTVVDFDSGSRVPFSLQALVDSRIAPLAAVDTIDSNGGTNIGLGMQTGYNQLLGSPTNDPKAAVLLTDGQGDYSNQAQLYKAKGWPVFTIGLSDEADEALLRKIATDTGGQYFSLTDPNQLIQVYFAIQAAVTGSDIVVETSFVMQQGQSASVPVAIDAGQNTANFAVNWPGSRVDSTLIDPNGRVITPETAQNDPSIYHAKGATYEIYRVANPPAGNWKVELYGAELDPSGEEVTVQVSQRDNELPTGAWGELGTGSASGGGISKTADESGRPSITHVGNEIYAAWVEERGQQSDIYVRRWNGSAWVDVGSGSASGGGVSGTATISQSPWLEAAPDGSVYLAWHEENGGGYDIYVRRWNGSAWAEVGAGSAAGGGISQTAGISQWPSVGITPGGAVYVAWEEATAADKEIYVRRFDGSSWVEAGAGSATGGGISNNSGDSGRPFLAIDQAGAPLVGWSDDTPGDTEIYVRRYNGSSWVEIGGSASGGGVSNNAGASRPPVLGVDSSGAIFVTWPDDSGGQFNIFVRRWDGNAWVEVGAGSAAGGGIIGTGEVSLAPHVAVAPDDTVYIIWYERLGTNTDILIRRWNGSFWVEVGVGSATGGGISNTQGASSLPSVTITGANMPVVAWTDNTSGNYEIYVKAWR